MFNENIQLTAVQTCMILQANNLLTQHGKVAMCAPCGVGKTRMAVRLLTDHHPAARVLVLTHGRTILRDQFAGVMTELDVPHATYEGGTFPDADVVVTLPHAICRRLDTLPTFDMVVVDEAHHFYYADDGMVQSILTKLQPKHEVLLTASAAKFVKSDFPRVMYSTQELRAEVPASQADVTTIIAQTTLNLSNEDYSQTDQLSDTYKLTEQTTTATLESVLDGLFKALTRDVGAKPHLFNGGETAWQRLTAPLFRKRLGKTVIATHSIAAANLVGSVLTAKFGADSVVTSHSKNDENSDNIALFSASDAKFLVVVDRGVLGFSLPSLRNFIDMTFTENPDTIFQMMGRLSRPDPTDPSPKVFVRVSPHSRIDRVYVTTCFSLALTHPEVFRTYVGDYLRTPFRAPRKLTKAERGEGSGKPKGKPQSQELPPIYLDDYTYMLNHLSHTDSAAISGTAYTTLNFELGGRDPEGKKKRLLELTKKPKKAIHYATPIIPTQSKAALVMILYSQGSFFKNTQSGMGGRMP